MRASMFLAQASRRLSAIELRGHHARKDLIDSRKGAAIDDLDCQGVRPTPGEGL